MAPMPGLSFAFSANNRNFVYFFGGGYHYTAFISERPNHTNTNPKIKLNPT